MTPLKIHIIATDGSFPINYQAEGVLHPDRRVEQTGQWTHLDGRSTGKDDGYGMIDIHSIRLTSGAEFPVDPATMKVKCQVVDILQVTEQEIEDLVEGALDAACLAIQERIGQTDGGLAGTYFSGSVREEFDQLFRTYIAQEKMFRS